MAMTNTFARLTLMCRTATLLVIVSFLSISCGSTDTSGSNTSADSEGVASVDVPEDESTIDSTPPVTDVDWPTTVAKFLAYELERGVIMDHAGMLACCGEGDPVVEQWRIRCDWVDDQGRLALDARPTAPTNASIEWAEYSLLVEQFWTGFQDTCDGLKAADFAPAADPTFGSEVFATGDARLAACEALLVELEPLPVDAPVAYCQFPLNVEIPVESYSDLPPDLAAALASDEGPGGGPDDGPNEDLDPTAGPTDAQLALLDPGFHTFEWFEPVFTINNDSPWLVESQIDRILIIEGGLEGPPDAVVELMGPGGLADPDQLVQTEDWTTGPVPTIAVPDDLTAWVDAMPVLSTPIALSIGGVNATYWKLEYDRSAEGNSVIVYGWQELDGALAVGLGEILHLWHVPRPDGSLLFFEQEFPGEGPPERQAPQLFEYFSFE